ncbi:MAG: glycosyltransferase family 87 protein [Rhizobiaceae bacterium]
MPSFTSSLAPPKEFVGAIMFIGIPSILYGLSLHIKLWMLGADGYSIVSHTTVYWDFNNLWTGGRLVLEGNINGLFDMEIYRSQMDRLLGQDVPDQEWSYPPSMLLIGVPLALLPIFWAYWVWTIGTIILLHIALRAFKLRLWVHLITLFSPFVFLNAMFGQNGTFFAALMLGGLMLAPKRPIIAGVLIGLMTIKPHLGILIPFCFIASRNWMAFVSASVTSVALFLITGVAFGFDAWGQFLQYTQPMMSDIMNAAYPQTYQSNAVTVFVFLRMLGGNLIVAYGVQALFSLVGIVCAIWLWRPANAIEHVDRVCLTSALVLLATPYGYTYDMVGLGAAIAIICSRYSTTVLTPLLAVVWLLPCYNHLLFAHFSLALGAAMMLAAVCLLYLIVKKSENNLLLSA